MWHGVESKKNKQASPVGKNVNGSALPVCVLLATSTTRCGAVAHDAIATHAVTTQQHSKQHSRSSGIPAFHHTGTARQQRQQDASHNRYIRASLQADGASPVESLPLTKAPTAANIRASSIQAVSAAGPLVLPTGNGLPGGSSSRRTSTAGVILPPDWQGGAVSERGKKESTDESIDRGRASKRTTVGVIAAGEQVQQGLVDHVEEAREGTTRIAGRRRTANNLYVNGQPGVRPIIGPSPAAVRASGAALVRDTARKSTSVLSDSPGRAYSRLVDHRGTVADAGIAIALRVPTTTFTTLAKRNAQRSPRKIDSIASGGGGTAAAAAAATFQPVNLARHLADILAKNDWRRVLDVFNEARRVDARLGSRGVEEVSRGVDPTRLSRGAYNQALLAYAMGRNGHGALSLLKEMRKVGGRLAPTRSSYNACLEVCTTTVHLIQGVVLM